MTVTIREENECDTCDNANVCPLKTEGCHGQFHIEKPKVKSDFEELRHQIKEDRD